MKDSVERFASVLSLGSKIGLIGVLLSFAMYVFGIIPARISIEKVGELWSLPLSDFIANSGIETGPWAWLGTAVYSDTLAVLTLAFLSILITLAYIWIIPSFVKEKRPAYVVMILAEITIVTAVMVGLF
ncbi:hypothetical protein MASR2M78_36640 [Treponema sp.]